MIGVGTIFRREVGQYFASPIAYLIAFAYLILTALVFNNDIVTSLNVKPTDPAAIPDFLTLGMILFAPLLTMRLLAEESREGTLELLLTAPIQDSAIVIGKFLSAWFYYSLLLFLTLIYQFLLIDIITPDFGHMMAAYIGIWLYGGAALSIGLMFSATTENQIVSAFLSMAVLLLLWLGDLAGQVVASVELANLVRTFTLQAHYSPSFAFGLVRAEDVAFFAGIIVVMLFVTIRIVESRRWR